MMMTHPFSDSTPPRLLSGMPRRGSAPGRDVARPSRFVTQSHALDGQVARPRAVFIAATIAVAVYLIGRRLRG